MPDDTTEPAPHKSFSNEQIETALLTLVAKRGAGKTVCPSEVSRYLAGSDETKWRLLMKPVRAVAVRLANEARVVIRRKGKPVDPDDFKGVYRVGPPDGSEG